MSTTRLPRGYRNNNCGNIRKSKDRWQGLRERQTDPAFFQFTTMAYGYRALLKTLRNYRLRHGCSTIADFIKRWAPETENNTTGYISRVCSMLQVPTAYVPDIDNKETMCSLAAAISTVENGRDPVMSDIYEGWELL